MNDPQRGYATQPLGHESPDVNEGIAPQMGAPVGTTPPVRGRRDNNRLLALLLIGLGVALLVGNISGNRQRHDTIGYPLNAAKMVRVRIEGGNGGITLRDGATSDAVLNGTVNYKGRLDVEDNGEGERELTFRTQDGGLWSWGNSDSAEWNLELNRTPVYEIDTEAGNGATTMDLRQLQVRRLKLEGGNGSLTLFLPKSGAVEGMIDSGNGAVTITLPPNRPARLEIDTGNGSITAPGLSRPDDGANEGRDGVYQTPDFDKAKEEDRIDLVIDTGNGSVTVK